MIHEYQSTLDQIQTAFQHSRREGRHFSPGEVSLVPKEVLRTASLEMSKGNALHVANYIINADTIYRNSVSQEVEPTVPLVATPEGPYQWLDPVGFEWSDMAWIARKAILIRAGIAGRLVVPDPVPDSTHYAIPDLSKIGLYQDEQEWQATQTANLVMPLAEIRDAALRKEISTKRARDEISKRLEIIATFRMAENLEVFPPKA